VKPLLFELNPTQKEAVEYTGGPSLIVAGPGSGKTRVLTGKIAYLIKEEKVAPGKILAVTFTNKASEEMRERVTRLLHHSPDLWIGTFHSICAKILREDGEAIGIPPGFIIYDESDQKDLIKNILKEAGIAGERFSPAAVRAAISASADGSRPWSGASMAVSLPTNRASPPTMIPRSRRRSGAICMAPSSLRSHIPPGWLIMSGARPHRLPARTSRIYLRGRSRLGRRRPELKHARPRVAHTRRCR